MSTLRRRVEVLEASRRGPKADEPGPNPLCQRCGGVCLPSVAALVSFDFHGPDEVCACGTDCPTCGGRRSPMRALERLAAGDDGEADA